MTWVVLANRHHVHYLVHSAALLDFPLLQVDQKSLNFQDALLVTLSYGLPHVSSADVWSLTLFLQTLTFEASVFDCTQTDLYCKSSPLVGVLLNTFCYALAEVTSYQIKVKKYSFFSQIIYVRNSEFCCVSLCLCLSLHVSFAFSPHGWLGKKYDQCFPSGTFSLFLSFLSSELIKFNILKVLLLLTI